MPNCPSYRFKKHSIEDKTNSGAGSPENPGYALEELCEHHNSPKPKGIIGRLPCHGNESKCPIPGGPD
jgi:hypothetical protein